MTDYVNSYHKFMIAYHISDKDMLFKLYDIFTLNEIFPLNPTITEVTAMQKVFGATDEHNFMEYHRKSNSYELFEQ